MYSSPTVNSSNSNQDKTDLSTNLVEYVTVTPNWQQQQHQQYQKQQNNSPYHVSDKETASTSSGSGPSGGNVCGNVSDASSSTFKINQGKFLFKSDSNYFNKIHHGY